MTKLLLFLAEDATFSTARSGDQFTMASWGSASVG